MPKLKELEGGYTAEVDRCDESQWTQVLGAFDDASLYQTWALGAVLSGERNCSRLVLKRDGEIVAAAQVRMAKVPVLNCGAAHIRWGPVWQRNGAGDPAVFRQAVRALRNEYAGRRGLVLRMLPVMSDADPTEQCAILEEEGFGRAEVKRTRTILMDLTPSLEELRKGMASNWRNGLKDAEKQNLEVAEGTSGALFDEFIPIYKEMVSRKQFAEPNDIFQFKRIQERLPEHLKMKILLVRVQGQACSGVIASVIGPRAVEIFRATNSAGLKSRGSFLLQWRLIQQMKEQGVRVYDLNGINPEGNPGAYKFKHELSGKNGRDVYFLGRFDASSSVLSEWSVQGGEAFRRARRGLSKRLASGPKPDAKVAQ